jgi:RNA polymerase sigma-70 factor (ECF subfamily)
LRKKKVRQHLSFWFGKGDPAEELDPTAEVPDRSPNAREGLMGAETGLLIQSALEKLPLRQRSAFVLRYLEGQSLEEIARHMEISEGAVKAELWHAAGKMRRWLKAYRLGEETL